jgi:hypothetical protein
VFVRGKFSANPTPKLATSNISTTRSLSVITNTIIETNMHHFTAFVEPLP